MATDKAVIEYEGVSLTLNLEYIDTIDYSIGTMIECFGDIINDKVITIGCLNLTQIDSFSARYVLSKATKSCCNHASSETWIHWIWNYTIVSFTSFVLQRCNPRIFGSIRHRMRARRIQSDSAHVTSRSCLRIPTMHAI